MNRGRPTIGGTPREKRAMVRLTEREHDQLAERFGTPGRALRYLVEQELRYRQKVQKPAADASRAAGAAEEETPLDVAVKKVRDLEEKNHRHRRQGDPIRVEYNQGTEVKVFACGCGQEMK